MTLHTPTILEGTHPTIHFDSGNEEPGMGGAILKVSEADNTTPHTFLIRAVEHLGQVKSPTGHLND